VRLEYDLVAAVNPAVGRLQSGRCGALTRILVGVAAVAGPGRLHCHLRRRAPAAGAAGPALLLHVWGRSRTACSCDHRLAARRLHFSGLANHCLSPSPLLHVRGRARTPTDPAPCSRGPSSASGPCALIAGGVPSSAGPAPGLRGQLSGRAVRPDYDHLADTTVTSAAVRRPPERPARRCCFSPGGDRAPARCRAPASHPPPQGCAP
jgi:hypothetical protein